MLSFFSKTTRWTSFRIAGLVMALVGTLSFAPHLFAHAVLQKSSPAARAIVSASDAASLPVVLTFNSRIDAGHSMLSLVASPGAKPVVVAVDKTAEPNVLRGVAVGLKPGHYQLQWQVVASDGHMSRGVVPFDVR